MKKETSMLNEGSITQDRYDKQLYKKVGDKQINSLSKRLTSFSNLS